jgi:hypothetical protein
MHFQLEANIHSYFTYTFVTRVATVSVYVLTYIVPA